MLILHCPNCGVDADETDLHAEGEAHLSRHKPSKTPSQLRDPVGRGEISHEHTPCHRWPIGQ